MYNIGQSDNDTGLSLGDVMVFIWKKKYRLIISIAILTLLGSRYITSLPKIYSASSTIIINKADSASPLSGLNPLMSKSSDELDTYMQLIRSRSFAGKIVQALQLAELPEFRRINQQDIPVIDLQHAISTLIDNLTLSRVTNTTMLTITYESKLATTSADVVNYIGPAFFESQSASKEASSRSQTDSLDKKLLTLKNQIKVAEDELKDFTGTNGLIDLSNQITLVITEISKLIEHQLRVDNSMSSASSTVQQIEAAQGNSDLLRQIPVILNDRLLTNIQNLLTTEKLAFNKVAERYKHKHHRYIAANGAVTTLQLNLQQTLAKVIDSHMQNLQNIKQRDQELSEQLRMARNRHVELGKHQFELLNLQRGVLIAQELQNAFRERKQETEILKALDNKDKFQVVDFAQVPDKPIRPNKLLGIAASFILSSVFSTVFWFISYVIADRQVRFKRLLSQNGISVMAEIPKSPSKSKKKRGSRDIEKFAHKEAIRALRTAILLFSEESNGRIVAITSVSPGEQATMLATHLAESFASREKCILVDANLRRPLVGAQVGLARQSPGLTDFINGHVKFGVASYQQPQKLLTIIPSGALPDDPIYYLAKPRITSFINKLGSMYERVIIDTPNLNRFSDVLMLSSAVDSVILQCDIKTTDEDTLLKGIQQLQDAGSNILGVVLINAKSANKNAFKKRRTVT
jgi:receptor protein-tyrosine kinase